MNNLQPLPEPRRFGPYELTHRISCVGKLGESYRATQRGVAGFEKPLLIKEIFLAYSQNEAFVERFVAKTSPAVKLHHANIVQVLDYGVLDCGHV